MNIKQKSPKKHNKKLASEPNDTLFRLHCDRKKQVDDIWDKLSKDLEYWKHQLRLDGVEIELRWLTFDEVVSDGRLGQWENLSPAHLFKIGISPLNLRVYESSYFFNCDYEVVLVHEMLHIVNSLWMDKGGIPQAMENEVLAELENNAIDTIAEALVRSRRGIMR